MQNDRKSQTPSSASLAAVSCLALSFCALPARASPPEVPVVKGSPDPVDRLVAQSAVGLVTSAAVPVAILSTVGVMAGTVLLFDMPLSVAAGGTIALATATLLVPPVLVDRVGARMGGHRNTLATIVGSAVGYGATTAINVAYWSSTPSEGRPPASLMVGSFLIPGVTAVIGYQIAEWTR